MECSADRGGQRPSRAKLSTGSMGVPIERGWLELHDSGTYSEGSRRQMRIYSPNFAFPAAVAY